MPSMMFFLSKLFFVLSWVVQITLLIYLTSKILGQQSGWIENVETLYISQKNLKKVAYLIFLFLILISIWDFDINDENCFLCLSRWYKYNAIFGIVSLCGYVINKVLSFVYKTEKYYEVNIKTFLNNVILKTLLSIVIYLFMSRIIYPN